MIANYTLDAKQRCFDLIDTDLDTIWESLEQMPSDTDADRWRRKLQSLAREYSFSSRFALMRLFLARADVSQLIDPGDPSRGFAAVLPDGTECRLTDITIGHAGQISLEELLAFEKLLLEQAARQTDPDPSEDSRLIHKALFPVAKKTDLLTREEAFRLGHSLQFTLPEMEWFLLRVLDLEDGFLFNTAHDLIEAYGFLAGLSSRAVARLQEEYERTSGQKPKVSDGKKAVNWTRDAGSSLPQMVQAWSVFSRDDQDKRFLAWLDERAPFLDAPSQTALRVYRNLAVFAYNLINQIEISPDVDTRKVRNGENETDFVRCIREIVQMPDYADQTEDALFENGQLSAERCKSVANALLRANKVYSLSEHSDLTLPWHTPQIKTNGKITVNGGINASRTRVADILYGKVSHPQKADMLYLLWFISNLCWSDGKSCPDISGRLSDFIDACEICLDAAGLPPFYPPHLVEQSMMLSVVYAFARSVPCTPTEVYEFACSSVIARRASRRSRKN